MLNPGLSGVAGQFAVFLTIDLGLHGYGSSLPDELVPALSWGFAYGCGVATTAAVLFPEVRSPKLWGRIVVLATVISGSYAFRLYLDPKPYLISGIPVLAVVAVVNAVDGVVRAYGDAMSVAEDALAPCTKHISIGTEDYHGVRATIEDVDVIMGVHGYGGGLFVTPSFGQIAPVFSRDFVGKAFAAQFDHFRLCSSASIPHVEPG